MADNDVYLVPTLVTYGAMERRGGEVGLTEVGAAKNREVLEAGRNAVALARDAGVRIGFGTDLMGELEDEQLAGLRLQCEVLGVYGALRSATSTNAALLLRDDLGGANRHQGRAGHLQRCPSDRRGHNVERSGCLRKPEGGLTDPTGVHVTSPWSLTRGWRVHATSGNRRAD